MKDNVLHRIVSLPPKCELGGNVYDELTGFNGKLTAVMVDIDDVEWSMIQPKSKDGIELPNAKWVATSRVKGI